MHCIYILFFPIIFEVAVSNLRTCEGLDNNKREIKAASATVIVGAWKKTLNVLRYIFTTMLIHLQSWKGV